MRPDGAPCLAANRVDLPIAVTASFREEHGRNYGIQGGIIPDTNLAWLSKGPLLQTVDTRNGLKVSAWSFGAIIKDCKTQVTCVVELPDSMPVVHLGSVRQLLVGLECELTGGVLCVFNLAGSRVLRAINIPSKVTALCLISAGGNLGPIHNFLKPTDGLAAVGTSDGQILLIDLQRKKCNKAMQSSTNNYWDYPRDELRPCGLTFMKSQTPQQHNYELLDDHFCFHLNERSFRKDQHLIIEFPNKEFEPFSPEDPSVTSLLYVPQLASLCVGFACGTFQIWSLQSLSLLYSSPMENMGPIVKLSFQEACDDPNAYCYLWAVRGKYNTIDSSTFGPGFATLYSLCYEEKQWLPGHGSLYMHLMMCTPRFEFDLTSFDGATGSRLISLYCISRAAQGQPQITNHVICEDSNSGISSNSVSLCLMVWETWGPSGPKSSCDPKNIHMALFDLNQWYADQMPGHILSRGGPSRNKAVASYFVMYDLGEALNSCEGLVLDIKLKQDTILQFSSVQNLEEFSRPASLSFSSVVLTEQQLIHLHHPGVQRALLSGLASAGPAALISPTNLYHECLALGLCPLLMDVTSSIHVSVEEQRILLLNVALEQHLSRFICKCAREWADGRSAAAGCTLSWLLSVIWNRAAVLKQLTVRICTPLFDFSGVKLDNNAQLQLRHILNVFRSIETLYQSVVHNKWQLSLNEWQQVELRKAAIELECKYYDVLQWFIDVELLPEGLNSSIPYPSEEIRNYYHSRRQEIHCLQQAKGQENQSALLIDALLNNESGGKDIASEWERDAGAHVGPEPGCYPPASLQGLLRTFLIKDVSLDVKYSIIIYVLMDLADVLDSQKYETALQKLMQFPAAFRMSLSSMRLTQAFWHLDHKGFDTAVDMLLDPLISTRDLKPWQHNFVICLLLLQGQPRLALRYVRTRQPPVEDLCDIRLHLDLLLSNDLINEAFMYQRCHQSADVDKSLLKQFFKGCEERDNLKSILQFSLKEDEEEAFAQYLEGCKHVAADDLRVLYLLKRSRYVEALDVNQELRKKGKSTSTRDIVVNAFFRTLPAVTRTLASQCSIQQNKLQSWKKVERPTPLFVSVKSASPEMRYKSSFIQAAVEKSRETWSKWTDKLPDNLSLVESTPFLCTPRTRMKDPSRMRHVQTSAVNAVVRSCKKRSRDDEEEGITTATQAKRSRFHELEDALLELQQLQSVSKPQPRQSTLSCVDALPLLHTPIVQRRSPTSREKLQQLILSSSPAVSTVTPQSIIKVRRADSSAVSESPSPSRILNKDPELTEEESDSEQSPTFRSKGDTDTDSEVEDESNIHKQERGVVRRTIDFESDSSSESLLQLSMNQTHFLPSHSPSPAGTPVQNSLSRMVVLSEAWKAGKPHNVTFGKDSVCIYDEDEPLNSSLQNEKSSENEVGDEVGSECLSKDLDEEKLGIEQPCTLSDPSYKRLDRLESSGVGTSIATSIEMSLSSSNSEVFLSADSIAMESLTSVSFRSSLSRPSIKQISQQLSNKKAVPEDTSIDSVLQATEDQERISEETCVLNVEDIEVEQPEEIASHMSDLSSSLGTDVELVMPASYEKNEKVCSSAPVALLNLETSAPQLLISSVVSVLDDQLELNPMSERKLEDSVLSGKSDVVEIMDSVSEESTLDCSDKVTEEQFEKPDSEEEIVELDQDESGFLRENSEKLTSFLDEEADQESFTFRKSLNHQFDSESSQSTVSLGKAIDSADAETTNFDSKYKNTDSNEYNLSNSDYDSRDPDVCDSHHSAVQDLNDAVVLEPDEISNDYDLRQGTLQSFSDVEHRKAEINNSCEGSNDSDQPTSMSYAEIYETEDLHLKQSSEEQGSLQVPCMSSELNQSIEVSKSACDSSLTKMKKSYNPDSAEVEELDSCTNSTDVNEAEDDLDLHKEENTESKKEENPDLNEEENPDSNNEKEPQDELPSLCLESSFESTFVSPEVRPVKSTNFDCKDSPSPKKNTTFSDLASHQETAVSPLPQGRKSLSPVSDHSVHNSSFSSEISGVSTRSKARATASLLTAKSEPFSAYSEQNAHNVSFSSHISEREVISDSCGSATVHSQKESNKILNEPDTVDPVCHSTNDQNFPEENLTVSVQSPRRSMRLRNSLNLEDVSTPTRRTRRRSVSSIGSLDTSLQEGKLSIQKNRHKKASSVTCDGSLPDDQSCTLLDQKLAQIPKDESASEKRVSEKSESRKREKDSGSSESFEPSSKKKKLSIESEQVRSPSKDVAILEYTTTRRLTRHQHAMLSRSLEVSSDYLSSSKKVDPVQQVEEQIDQLSDDDKTSICSVRSSLRLREKYERQAAASPCSTASTIINPALTPNSRQRRRQSSANVSDSQMEGPASPVSSRQRRKSLPSPSSPSRTSTPTRRSSLFGSTHQDTESDDHSLTSVSPSSTTSSYRRRPQRQGRRLSLSSENASEQFAFASPLETAGRSSGADISSHESFTFSPPKVVALPSTSHSPSVSRKTRQHRKSVLPVINEESSSLVNQSDSPSLSRKKSGPRRRSWYFVDEKTPESSDKKEERLSHEVKNSKPQVYSAFPSHKEFVVKALPVGYDSEEDEKGEKGKGNTGSAKSVKLRRSSRNQTSRGKGKKRKP